MYRVHNYSWFLTLSGIHYAAGDIMMVAPKNPADDVEQFLTLMHLNPNDVITLTPNDRFTKLPKKVSQPCTWRYIAENYLDICGTPKRYDCIICCILQ